MKNWSKYVEDLHDYRDRQKTRTHPKDSVPSRTNSMEEEHKVLRNHNKQRYDLEKSLKIQRAGNSSNNTSIVQ